MAAAVLPASNTTVSPPFTMSSHQHISSPSPLPAASSSRSKQPSLSSHPPAQDSTLKPFNRIRTTLEQSIRSATRSKKLPAPAADDFATVRNPTDTNKGKGKEKAVEERSSGMLRRLESKVNFRRSGRDSVTPSPSPIPPSTPAKASKPDKVRLAGFTSFQTPSLRQASMSSPALHLSSQALPSPKSQPAIPASSSSTSDALVSPTRDKSRRASVQPVSRDPPALTPKHEARGSAHTSSTSKESTPTRHRSTKSAPIDIPISSSVISLHSPPETPKRRNRDRPSSPDTPTPVSGSRSQLTRNPSSRQGASSSTSHLPLNNSPPSPISPRGPSPIRARSPSTTRNRMISPSHRGLTSSSPSHLPNTSPSPPPTPTRVDPHIRRPSIDSPQKPSFGRDESPSPAPARTRPISPNQRSYAHNRHFNISSTSLSLSSPSNPEHRELIRTATSMLCKIVKPPVHMSRTEAGMRDWDEVEVRTRALARLERIWGKSGISASSSNVNVGAMSSSGLSAAGEERERRLFTEALRDGFVLCQLMNKLRSSSVVRPDPREDGFVRTSNITKFLAACSSYGLPNEDLFLRDDLIEASGESLARVAKTIIALIKYVETPIIERSKFISGGKKSSIGSSGGAPRTVSGPYKLGSISSRSGAASTPNLLSSQAHAGSNSNIGNTSAAGTGPTRHPSKRWTPPSGLPPVRSDSSDEGTISKSKDGGSGSETAMTHDFKFKRRDRPPEVHVDDDRQVKDVPSVLTPPPRSPLRAKPSPNPPDDGRTLFTWAVNNSFPSRASAADSTRASVGDSVRESISVSPDTNMRQSMASTTMTDITTSTTTTVLSSLMDVGRASSAVFSKFGTIRTMTTEATSETPSITRTEGSSIADDLARKYRGSSDAQHSRDRKLSDVPVVDLSRVVEETDESGSSSRGGRDKGRRKAAEEKKDTETDRFEKVPAIHLGKGKWPDDFVDALQNPPQSPSIPNTPTSLDPEDRVRNTSSLLSSSPPRKLAIVGASRRNESVESLPQFPRKPSHRARHSIDTPALLPRESVYRRDVSPEGLSSNRVMLRRHSTKPGPRNGVYTPKGSDDPRGSDSDNMVPFPRTVSGEHAISGSNSPHSSSVALSDDPSGSSPADKPRQIRGRFQSDIEGSSRRRARPNSYDELGVKPTRSRFESMVNLGGASSNASASDLLNRDSMDGSAVRKPLIIKEEGKLPTHFQLGNCIGRGQFGSVYRALNLNTGQMVAVKRIRLEGLKEEEVTQLMREVDLVKRLSHPSIVKYEGMARDADTLSIILEYAENGSLGQTLKAFGKLNERLVASYVVRILEGLHYLHQSDVVHCDLKAANILTTKNGNVKLSDFGVSLNMRAMEREIKDVAGTPNWMAPEVIELKGASPKSDIWSLACTVIELLTGRPPYGDIPNSMSVMFRIVEDDMPPIPPGVSPLLEDFLKKCFNKDPTQRPSAELLCEHEWLKQNWGAHKELRPQDSIPFLRRVSADLQKSEAVRYLSQIEMPEATPEHPRRADDVVSGSPPGRRMSNSSMKPSIDEISPRGHSFVKTTFSKPMVCRVCLLNVKKSAVLCAQCSLICHSKCAVNSPPTCDLRAQLLLYAQYAEKGNPSSAYSNPVDVLNEMHPKSPMSDVPYVSHTPRTSLDTAPPVPQGPTPHPPTAFKYLPFKRKGQSTESGQSSPSSSPPQDNPIRKPTVLRKGNNDRPQSLGSNSTNANSSLRSAITAASAGGKSTISDIETGASFSAIGESDARASGVTSRSGVSEASVDNRMPGDLSEDSRRHRKNKSSNNCIVQ